MTLYGITGKVYLIFMFNAEIRRLLVQVISSWQVIVVTIVLIVYISIVSYVARIYNSGRSRQPRAPKAKKENPVAPPTPADDDLELEEEA